MKILNILGHKYLSMDDKHVIAVRERFPDTEGKYPCFDKNYSYDRYKFYVAVTDTSRGISDEDELLLIQKFKLPAMVEIVQVGDYFIEKCSHSEKLIEDFQKWYTKLQQEQFEHMKRIAPSFAGSNFSTMYGGDCE